MARKILSSLILILLASCSTSEAGDRILIVSIIGEKATSRPVSEATAIKESLEKGGQIYIDVESARKLDPQFVESYTVTNSEGNFFIKAAILNFVGSHGWHLQQAGEIAFGNQEYFFTKSHR